MGNKQPTLSYKYASDHEPWALIFFVRIGVLVPGPMTKEKTTALRAMNNYDVAKRVSKGKMAKYEEQCVPTSQASLFILNDWRDYTYEFQVLVTKISKELGIDWFVVALTYCESNFDEEKTWERCRNNIALAVLRNYSSDDEPWFDMWVFTNLFFKKIPSFVNHIGGN